LTLLAGDAVGRLAAMPVRLQAGRVGLLDSYQVDLRAVICEWLNNQ